MAKKSGKAAITIIKKEEVIAGGHHGGAWKVAYADFVTAMMAFFLLMWLLNATTEAQKRGLADYFAPTVTTARGASGDGRPLSGRSPFEDGPALSDRGALPTSNSNAPPVDLDDDGSDTLALRSIHAEPAGGGQDHAGLGAKAAPGQAGKPAEDAAAHAEQERLKAQAAAMRRALAADPATATAGRQVSGDVTPDGVLIQIRDEEQRPMFASGSAEPTPRIRALLTRIAPVLARMSEPVSVAGYTDAAAFAGAQGSNWDLSTERAQAARRILTEQGLPDGRIADITGHGSRDLLLPADPMAAANRRIAILLHRTSR